MKESGEKLQPSQLKIQALTIDLETASTEKSNVNEEMYQLTVSRDEAIVKADSLKLELDNLSDTVEQEKTHRAQTSGELEMGLRQALKDQADASQSLVT